MRKRIQLLILVLVLAGITGLSAYLTLTILTTSETIKVPDLAGKDVVAVLAILESRGLKPSLKGSEFSVAIPKGAVIYQDPAPGEEIKKGRAVKIVVSKGTQALAMPDITGITIQQALLMLEQNGLKPASQAVSHHFQIPSETVIAQVPSPGTEINHNENIHLLISAGKHPQAYLMPSLIGLNLNIAMDMLTKMGLQSGEIQSSYVYSKSRNSIIRQEPMAGASITAENIVSLVVNRKAVPTSTATEVDLQKVIFRYQLSPGYLNRHIRVNLTTCGNSFDFFNRFMPPGKKIWLIIPECENTTLCLYEDGELIKTELYNIW